ncbi:MAG: YcxB family protein [Clostridiales bacterium]|jgi:hypothetical protein|nr:YcxB family protein [Clostridiales bacterium]
MRIEAVSSLTYEQYKAFFHFLLFGRNRFLSLLFKAGIVFSMFLCAVIFGMFLGSGTGFFSLLLSIALPAAYGFAFFVLPKSVYSSGKKLYDAPIKYVFTETQFVSHSQNELFENTTTMKYACIMKVYETPEYFFIFPDKSRAEIIHKSTFTVGTPYDLRFVLMNSLPRQSYITM